MGLFKPSALLTCAIFFGLSVILARETIVFFLRWQEGKMGLSIMEVESKYVKFPSFSVCLDLDVNRDKMGFKEMRPLNETFSFLSYVRHFNNGSDIPFQIWDIDGFMNGEGLRTHVIVRDGGHYYGNCIAFDPPDMAPVGMDSKVKIGLKIQPKDEMYLFIYDKDQIYIPSVSRIYGSDFRKISDIRMKEDKYGHYQYYEIFRTHYKELNEPPNNCDEGDGKMTVKDCIESFIDSHLGCHIPWHTNGQEGEENCFNEEHFKRYVKISDKLSSLNAKDMEHETGCMRYCSRVEYQLWESTPLGMKAKYKPEWLTLSFIFSSGNYELKEQYAIYDGNVFLADIGGYFGLLLGFSLFDIFRYLINNSEGIRKWLLRERQAKLPSKTPNGGITRFPVKEMF